MKNIKFGSSESGSESSKDSSEYYVFNLKFFSDFYDAITSALSVQYEGIFKSKAEERPFAESQEAKPPLERVQIEEVFLKFTHGNGSESGYVKGLDKQIPMYALQRKPSNNDSLNREERKTAFRTECPLPTEIQASPDIILLSESLPLKSEPYSDEFKSHKIRAVEEKGVLPSVIHTERGVSGLMLPIKPHMGQEISIHEEAETPMQNSIPEALKPTQDPPQLFTKLFQLGLEVIDTFGMVITTERFRVEYMGYQKQNPPTSERTKEEDKNNKSVKIRTYADDSTIKRFQTKIDSKFKVEESEPVPFLIPIGQAHSVLPRLSSIQEVTKNSRDRFNSNEITLTNDFTDQTNQSNLGSKNNTKIIINHSCYAPVQTEEQLKLMRTNASILKSKNRYEINPAYKPTKKDLTDTHLHGSRSYKDKRGLMINPGNGGTRLNSAQESLLVENLGTQKPVRSTNSDNFVPLSLIQDVSEPIAPLSSLQKEQESSLTKSNENNEKKADISLVISKEGEEDLSTLQVPLDEHDGPQRREREQLGIDPSPSKSRRPVDDSRYNEYRGAKSSMVGSRNQPSGEESGLASENNGAGTKIIQRSEAFNAVVPKSSLHGIVTQHVSPDPQQNHLP